MRLKTSRFVESDLAEIDASISLGSPRNATKLVSSITRLLREIAKRPLLYRLRPELGLDVRLAPVGQYVILFRIYKDFVRIERIVHGNRELFSIMEEADPPIAH